MTCDFKIFLIQLIIQRLPFRIHIRRRSGIRNRFLCGSGILLLNLHIQIIAALTQYGLIGGGFHDTLHAGDIGKRVKIHLVQDIVQGFLLRLHHRLTCFCFGFDRSYDILRLSRTGLLGLLLKRLLDLRKRSLRSLVIGLGSQVGGKDLKLYNILLAQTGRIVRCIIRNIGCRIICGIVNCIIVDCIIVNRVVRRIVNCSIG